MLAVAALPPAAADAAFPGANGRIAFIDTEVNPDGTATQSVRSVRPNGRGVRTLISHTAEPPARPLYGPRWAPSGRRFVVEYLDAITVVSSDGRSRRALG